ncbi:unnamed protein product [Somion occarium]|uniref:Reticulon-like protein n=1 Tax=Somion occarium TaxID=3059160 RepID=A0ABP1CTI7_9APHY
MPVISDALIVLELESIRVTPTASASAALGSTTAVVTDSVANNAAAAILSFLHSLISRHPIYSWLFIFLSFCVVTRFLVTLLLHQLEKGATRDNETIITSEEERRWLKEGYSIIVEGEELEGGTRAAALLQTRRLYQALSRAELL